MINLAIIFSKIFSLAALARLRFIPDLEMKPSKCFTNFIYIFVFLCFWVIISYLLPKFTENTHKIAQNCVYNVQKLFAGGWQIKGAGDVKMGGIAPWLLGG